MLPVGVHPARVRVAVVRRPAPTRGDPRPQAAVLAEREHLRPARARNFGCSVGRAVVDDEHVRLRKLLPKLLEHRRQVLLLVPRRDEDDGVGHSGRTVAPSLAASRTRREAHEHPWNSPTRRAERLAERRLSLIAVHALAVSAENVARTDAAEPLPRRDRTQKRMNAEHLAWSAEGRNRPESVGDAEHPLLVPPERGLLPEAALADEQELERDAVEPSERHDVMRYAEARGESSAVARMAVEQLNNATGLAERANPVVHAIRLDRIDDPDASGGQQRMRRSLHPTGVDPAEAPVGLVAEARHG